MSYAEEQNALEDAYKKGYDDGYLDGYLKAQQEEFEKRSKSGKKRWAGVSLEKRMEYAKWMRRGKCLGKGGGIP